MHICRVLDLPLDELAAEYASEVSDPGSIRVLCESLRVQGEAQKVLPLLEVLPQKAKGTLSEPAVYLELGRVYTCLNRFADAQREFANAIDAASHRAASSAEEAPTLGEKGSRARTNPCSALQGRVRTGTVAHTSHGAFPERVRSSQSRHIKAWRRVGHAGGASILLLCHRTLPTKHRI